jgi:hypothetical protein
VLNASARALTSSKDVLSSCEVVLTPSPTFCSATGTTDMLCGWFATPD